MSIFCRDVAENISEDLANYITMTLDPNVGNLVSFMKDDIPSYEDTLVRLQNELDQKLVESESSLIEVFHKIAMKLVNAPKRFLLFYCHLLTKRYFKGVRTLLFCVRCIASF